MNEEESEIVIGNVVLGVTDGFDEEAVVVRVMVRRRRLSVAVRAVVTETAVVQRCSQRPRRRERVVTE